MLGSLKKTFSVIGISETWLTDCTAELVNITGYSFISNHRKSKTGGGVGIYLHSDLQYKLLNECKLPNPESLYSYRLQFPMGKILLLDVCIGRQTKKHGLSQFLDQLNDILSYISKDNKQMLWVTSTLTFFSTIIIHQLKDLSHFIFVCIHTSHLQLTQRATPPTLQLQLIIYSQTIFHKMFKNGVVLNDLSDHLPVFKLIFFWPNPYARWR